MFKRLAVTIGILMVFGITEFTGTAIAASAVEIDAKTDSALKMFYEKVGLAKELSAKAKGILVFPDIIKAGFGIGGEYGEGALRINGKTVEYYNTAAAVEWGAGGSVDTNNIKDPIIGFVFGNKGLMFNLTLEGSKMSKIKR